MYGYIKVGAAVPKVRVADCRYNGARIMECVYEAAERDVKFLVLPELAVCSYSCGDLFFQTKLIAECEKVMAEIAEKSAALDMVLIIGSPVMAGGRLYNCAVALHGGRPLGIVPKEILPTHSEFSESRWFKSGKYARDASVNSVMFLGAEVPFGSIIFKCENYDYFNFAIEVCADFWSVTPPSDAYSLKGATVIANLSASPVYSGKHLKRRRIAVNQSEKCMCVYIYCASSPGESSASSVFDGHAIIAAQGEVSAETERYSFENELIVSTEDLESIAVSRVKSSVFEGDSARLGDIKTVCFRFEGSDDREPDITPSRTPFIPSMDMDEFCSEIIDIQTSALRKRLEHTGIRKIVLGVSGGLDSTLALLSAVRCLDKMEISRENLIGITMPGLGTSSSTRSNAIELMKELGVTAREIPIAKACDGHFEDIGYPQERMDNVYENAQARERTQILMDIANMENGLVLGTGDMSELALGWATYNGDHMSMYGLNAGLPKTVIRTLVTRLADDCAFGEKVSGILRDILGTPISPELLPADESGSISQKTEDLVGPYELHDFFIYHAVHNCSSPKKISWLAKRAFSGIYSDEIIAKWLGVFYKRLFSQQFKRSCSPDSPKILELALTQKTDLNIPSDTCGELWKPEE